MGAEAFGPGEDPFGGDRATGIDLSQEENVAALECPVLVAHMDARRDAYQKSLQALEGAPTEAQCRVAGVELQGSLAAALSDLKESEALTRLDRTADEAAVLARHLTQAAAGRAVEPHFPTPLPPGVAADPAFQKLAAATVKRISAWSDDLTEAHKAVAKNVREMEKMRTVLIRTWDSMLQLLHDQKRLCDDQRRLLAEVAHIYEFRDRLDAKSLARVKAVMKGAVKA